MSAEVPTSTWRAFRMSLSLLAPRERRILGLVAIAQMGTSILDLVGVLLIGAVAGLAVAYSAQTPPPPMVERLASMVGVEDADTSSLVGVVALAALAVLVLKSFLSVYLTRRMLRFLANRQATVSGRLAETLLSRPLLLVLRRSSQETAYALTSGVNLAILVIIGQVVVAASEVVLLAVLALGLLLLDPLVTIFAVGYFALIAVVLQRLMSDWASRLGRTAGDAEIQSYETVQEVIRAYREVIIANRRNFYVEKFQSLRRLSASVQSDLHFMQLVPKYLFEVALVLGAAALAGIQLFTRDLPAAIATIVIFLAAGSRVVPAMLRLQGALLAIRSASGGACQTYELATELKGEGNDSAEKNPMRSGDLNSSITGAYGGFEAALSMSGVSVTYPNSTSPALQDISLSLKEGESLALVGATGSGKSTLADVLLGVLTPDSGLVRIGGLDPLGAVVRHPGAIAYVPQDVALANGSIRENVALGLPPELIDDDRIWEALTRAHLADFLRHSRDGIQTLIGENGVRLSGGQRQRLGVARALYTRPRLLVLDEATSALDAQTENEIVQTLADLEGDVTTVTIAHRLATIRNSDLVVFLDRGRIVASGSFEEVRLEVPDFDRQARLLGL